MKRGIATFTLDYGRCPPWLFERMVKLGREMILLLVEEFGPEEFVARLGDPVWFQALGTVLAFDWNASGLTTVLMGALKEAMKGSESELGIYICGGKGKTSRKTPDQIESWGEKIGLSASRVKTFKYNSRMSAKVDSALIQDGYELYHHNFIFSKSGAWTVVQQGMNQTNKSARRYHWHSLNLKDLIVEPHTGITSRFIGVPALNMTAAESDKNRALSVELLGNGCDSLLKDLRMISKYSNDLTRMVNLKSNTDSLTLLRLRSGEFSHHEVELEDFSKSKYLQKILLKLSDDKPENYEMLVEREGVGPKTIRALSLVGELIYGATPSYQDPARYSFTHGGKDATPYAVDRQTYDQTIAVMKRVIGRTKIKFSDKTKALRRLEA